MKSLNRFGYSAIEITISLMIISIAALSFGSFASLLAKVDGNINKNMKLTDVKSNVFLMLSDRRVWNQIVGAANTDYPLDTSKKMNAELDCIKNSTMCTAGEYPLTILDQGGRIYFDSMKADVGFSPKGDSCTGFNEDTENKDCPYQLRVKWKPICPTSGSCTDPQIQILVQTVSSKNSQNLNASNLTVASMVIEKPIELPPVVKTSSVYTNAKSEPTGHEVIYNVTSNVGTSNSSDSWYIVLDAGMTNSSNGGAVSLVDNKTINYMPPDNFHGVDKITYRVRLKNSSYSALGTLYVKVMTQFTWTGVANNRWTFKDNWCGSVSDDKKSCLGATTIPSNLSLAIIDLTCSSANCNPSIISNTTVGGIEISGNSLIQQPFNTLTVGNKNFTVLGGSFVGGNSTVTLNGNLILSGGTFTATSGSTNMYQSIVVSGSPGFNHNSGVFNFLNQLSHTQTPGDIEFNNVIFGNNYQTTTIVGSGMRVKGTVSFNSTWNVPTLVGTILAYGNVTASGVGMRGNGLIKLVGSTDQMISTTGASAIPSVEIASTGGKVIFGSVLSLAGSIFKYTSGVVDALSQNGRVNFIHQLSNTITPGPIEFNEVNFGDNYQATTISGGDMIVKGALAFNSTWNVATLVGTILAYGNVSASGVGMRGNGLIKLVGSTDQVISTTGSSAIPCLEIASTGGKVIFDSLVNIVGNNFKYTSGTVDAITNNSTINFVITQNNTITPGNIDFNNVNFSDNYGTTAISGSELKVKGTLAFNSNWNTPQITGTIAAYGDVSASSIGMRGPGTLKFVGSGDQKVKATTGAGITNGPIIVDKPSGNLNLDSDISISATGQNLTVNSGNINMQGYRLSVGSTLTLATGRVITKNGGLLLVNGSIVGTGSYSNGTINP